MNRHAAILILLPCLMGACATTDALHLYEYDLVSMIHNSENGYTLLVYHNVLGEARHVLRQEGICEIVIVYTPSGSIKLKERGRRERKIDAYVAGRLTAQINALLHEGQPGPQRSTSNI